MKRQMTIKEAFESLNKNYTPVNVLKYISFLRTQPVDSLLENSQYIFGEPSQGARFFQDVLKTVDFKPDQILTVKENLSRVTGNMITDKYENTEHLEILQETVNFLHETAMYKLSADYLKSSTIIQLVSEAAKPTLQYKPGVNVWAENELDKIVLGINTDPAYVDQYVKMIRKIQKEKQMVGLFNPITLLARNTTIILGGAVLLTGAALILILGVPLILVTAISQGKLDKKLGKGYVYVLDGEIKKVQDQLSSADTKQQKLLNDYLANLQKARSQLIEFNGNRKPIALVTEGGITYSMAKIGIWTGHHMIVKPIAVFTAAVAKQDQEDVLKKMISNSQEAIKIYSEAKHKVDNEGADIKDVLKYGLTPGLTLDNTIEGLHYSISLLKKRIKQIQSKKIATESVLAVIAGIATLLSAAMVARSVSDWLKKDEDGKSIEAKLRESRKEIEKISHAARTKPDIDKAITFIEKHLSDVNSSSKEVRLKGKSYLSQEFRTDSINRHVKKIEKILHELKYRKTSVKEGIMDMQPDVIYEDEPAERIYGKNGKGLNHQEDDEDELALGKPIPSDGIQILTREGTEIELDIDLDDDDIDDDDLDLDDFDEDCDVMDEDDFDEDDFDEDEECINESSLRHEFAINFVETFMNESSEINMESFNEMIRIATKMDILTEAVKQGQGGILRKAALKAEDASRATAHGIRKFVADRKHFTVVAKRVPEHIDNLVNGTIDSIKNMDKDERRKRIVEGSFRLKLFKLVRNGILLGGVAYFAPALAAIGFLASFAIDKALDHRVRQQILDELEEELKIVNEKIEDAKGDSNKQNKYQLMRIKSKLENDIRRIQYRLKKY